MESAVRAERAHETHGKAQIDMIPPDKKQDPDSRQGTSTTKREIGIDLGGTNQSRTEIGQHIIENFVFGFKPSR